MNTMEEADANVPKPFLHPLDIISFVLESSGRTTNTSLVKHFSSYLTGTDVVAVTNKNILKSVTSHIASLRRQGTRDGASLRQMDVGGKLIVLRNRFRGKSAEDIWSSLILSLPMEEITRLTPTHEEKTDISKDNGNKCDNNADTDVNKDDEQVDTVDEDDEIKSDNSVQNKTEGRIDDISVDDPEFIETSQYDIIYNRRTDIEEDPGSNDNMIEEESDTNSSKVSVEDFDKTRSVRDLTRNFNDIANSSSVNLVDLISSKNVTNENKNKKIEGGRHKTVISDKSIPLSISKEERSWLVAAMRGDYQTLARVARSQPEMALVRDPATGYSALHWAAKLGQTDMIKLLAGTYELDTNMRTRGGNTPLHLAAMCKKYEAYDLMVNTYAADETARDYSGRTPAQYLDMRHLPVPGVPPRVELSHDVWDVGDEVDGDTRADRHVRRSRRHVARSATNHFLKEFRDSMRDVRGSLRENWLRPKSGVDSKEFTF